MSETEITGAEAEKNYGVTCKHSMMANNELRFRLLKNDGTAYIRTEAPPSGGWQNSHYHNKVKETYIVQSGWIGYAELVGDIPKFYIYNVDESFTTRPAVVHNVYMPAGAVIHTVKHGEAQGEARLENEITQKFNTQTKRLSEIKLQEVARQGKTKQTINSVIEYNEGYRHFDNLIWQVPAWSTAIFAGVLNGIGLLKPDNVFVKFVESLGYTAESLIATIFGVFSIFIFVLAYALYRFRWHQVATKSYTPQHPLKSPQVFLQLVVLSQGLIFFMLCMLMLFPIPKYPWIIFCVCGVILTVVTFIVERILKKKGGGRPISTRS